MKFFPHLVDLIINQNEEKKQFPEKVGDSISVHSTENCCVMENSVEKPAIETEEHTSKAEMAAPSASGSRNTSYEELIRRILLDGSSNGTSTERIVQKINQTQCIFGEDIFSNVKNALKRMMALGLIYPHIYSPKMRFKLTPKGRAMKVLAVKKRRKQSKPRGKQKSKRISKR